MPINKKRVKPTNTCLTGIPHIVHIRCRTRLNRFQWKQEHKLPDCKPKRNINHSWDMAKTILIPNTTIIITLTTHIQCIPHIFPIQEVTLYHKKDSKENKLRLNLKTI